jgi:hypothetical protein
MFMIEFSSVQCSSSSRFSSRLISSHLISSHLIQSNHLPSSSSLFKIFKQKWSSSPHTSLNFLCFLRHNIHSTSCFTNIFNPSQNVFLDFIHLLQIIDLSNIFHEIQIYIVLEISSDLKCSFSLIKII